MTPEEQAPYRLNGDSELETEAWAALETGVEAWRGIVKVCMALGREMVAQRGRIVALEVQVAKMRVWQEQQMGDGR